MILIMTLMKYKDYFRSLIPVNSFRANVLTIMTGTSLAQAIPLLVSPILTRCYSPDDFGAFAVFMAVVSSVGVLSTGRYELAIMLPENDDDAFNLLTLSIIVSFFVCVIALLVVIVFHNDIALFMKVSKKWLYLIPLFLFFMGVYQAVTVWLNRRGHYGILAKNRVYQGIATALMSVGMGFSHIGSSGLIAGSLAGQVIATGEICRNVWNDTKGKLNILSKDSIINLAKRYKDFPKYDILSAFLNILANQIPVFLFSSYFGVVTVGFYALTVRVVKAPSSLISNSILEAFKQRASSDFNKYGNCHDIYLKTLKSLVLLAILPTALLLFASPILFSVIFGKQWVVAGEYAQIMSVMFFFGFISSPLSYVFFIAEKQLYNLIWQTFLIVFSVASILLGAYLKNVKVALVIYSVSYSILYVIYLAMSYKLSKGSYK